MNITALKLASYLTEPVCKVREYFYSFYILSETCKTTMQKVIKIALLSLGLVVCALLTPITTPIGVAIRGAVAFLQSTPHIEIQREQLGKELPQNRKITLVSHNQCYMPGGYAITDGQVTPPSDSARMVANMERIRKLDPDIVCLYEVPDILDAETISSHLPEYPFLIPVAGIRAIGPSSMMYVASKYKLASVEFIPFIKGVELTGRAQSSEKGFLSFKLKSRGEEKPFATLISTHLQHSEIPAKPEPDEEQARFLQMKKITDRIRSEAGPLIFTGDLNQAEDELKAFLARHQIDWLQRDPAVEGIPTWGGDQWCARLMKKLASGPLVLDYTLVKEASISTKIIPTGYSGLEFRATAGSDHDLLYSEVLLKLASASP